MSTGKCHGGGASEGSTAEPEVGAASQGRAEIRGLTTEGALDRIQTSEMPSLHLLWMSNFLTGRAVSREFLDVRSGPAVGTLDWLPAFTHGQQG